MTQTSIATSADYADALLVARRGKHLLFLLLLLMLLGQIALFFVARYTSAVVPEGAPTTRSAVAHDLLRYLTGATTFFGTVLPVLLCLVLLLIVNIMLVGRLLGLARLTSAFLWCLLLMLLLFPVQVFFGGSTDPRDFRLPGLMVTWDELVLYAKFGTDNLHLAVMKWTRFLVMPLVAVVLLAIVQIKSNRGLRQALGEAAPDLAREM
jgi:hypothetical protein